MACDNFYGKRWTVNNAVNSRSELEVYLRNGSNCAWHEHAAVMSRLFIYLFFYATDPCKSQAAHITSAE